MKREILHHKNVYVCFSFQMEITNSSVVRSANVLDQLMSSPNAVTNEVDIKYATEIIEKIVSTESGDLKKVRNI